jgi:hypothetical protein
MHSFVWFIAILALALMYGMRIRGVVGHITAPLLHWRVAVALAIGLMCGAILTVHSGIQVPRQTAVAIHAVVLFVATTLGLRYWIHWPLWDIPSAVGALALVALYFTEPQTYNNVVLALVSLGVAVGGYYCSKHWLVVFSLTMAAFDAYAVWGSNLMEQLIDQQPGPFPSALTAALMPRSLEIGGLDVMLGALMVVGIFRHRGIVRAAGFGICYASLTWGIAVLSEPLAYRYGSVFLAHFPLLTVLAPLVLLFLLGFPRRHRA